MSSPESRPIGEIVADVEKTDPALAAEVLAVLSARRVQDDLADAEAGLREFARTGRDGIARWLAVLLVEYDRRNGQVLKEPERVSQLPPAREPRPPRLRDAGGDVIAG